MHVVVVGAGILGASAAYHLARAGARVTVVDQSHEGRATAAGAGIICPWVSGVDDPVFYGLYTEAARYYGGLIAGLAEVGEADVGFRRTGALVVSSDPEELTAFQAMLTRRQADTPEMGAISLLTPDETRELFPPLRPDFAAVHIAGGARVDGRRMATGLLRAAQSHGATLLEGCATLMASGGRVTGVSVRDAGIAADRIVITTGAWAPALLQPFGVCLPIEPQRGQIVHLHLPGQDTRVWPVILPPGSHYLLAFDGGHVRDIIRDS